MQAFLSSTVDRVAAVDRMALQRQNAMTGYALSGSPFPLSGDESSKSFSTIDRCALAAAPATPSTYYSMGTASNFTQEIKTYPVSPVKKRPAAANAKAQEKTSKPKTQKGKPAAKKENERKNFKVQKRPACAQP